MDTTIWKKSETNNVQKLFFQQFIKNNLKESFIHKKIKKNLLIGELILKYLWNIKILLMIFFLDKWALKN